MMRLKFHDFRMEILLGMFFAMVAVYFLLIGTGRLRADEAPPQAPVVNSEGCRPITYAQARKKAEKLRSGHFILAVRELPRSSVEFYGAPVYLCVDPPANAEPGHYQCGTRSGEPYWWKTGQNSWKPMQAPPVQQPAAVVPPIIISRSVQGPIGTSADGRYGIPTVLPVQGVPASPFFIPITSVQSAVPVSTSSPVGMVTDPIYTPVRGVAQAGDINCSGSG